MQREQRLKNSPRRELLDCRQSLKLGNQLGPRLLAAQEKIQQNLFVVPDRLWWSRQRLLAAIDGRFAKIFQDQAGVHPQVSCYITSNGRPLYLIG